MLSRRRWELVTERGIELVIHVCGISAIFFAHMFLVELDNLLHCVHRSFWSKGNEIGVQVSLEFVEQHCKFPIAQVLERLDIRGIDNHRSLVFHGGNGGIGQPIDKLVVAEQLPHHANACTLEPARVQELCVVCQ